MKQKIGKVLLLIPILFIVLFACAILRRKAQTDSDAERISILPALVLTDLDGNKYNTSQLSSGPLLVTFFHPECDHCRYELTSLMTDGSFNRNVEVLLISYEEETKIRSFIKELRLSDLPNVHVVHDQDYKLSHLFGATIIPANFIYNDSLFLVKRFKGSVKPETIMKYLNGNY